MNRKMELAHLAIAEKAVADEERQTIQLVEGLIAESHRNPGTQLVEHDGTPQPEPILGARYCNRHP